MRNFFTLYLLLITHNNLFSQIVFNPFVASQDFSEFTIDKIEVKDNFTIVDFTFTSNDDFICGGWVQINPDIILKESSGVKVYKMLKSEGMPLSPKKHIFSFNGEKLKFKLYFPKIDKNIKTIDIIESENNTGFFNFFGISVAKEKSKNKTVENLSDDFISFLPSEMKNIFSNASFVDSQNNKSVASIFNVLIEKNSTENSKEIDKITIDEIENGISYAFYLNSKINPVIEFFFKKDSKLNEGVDFIRFSFFDKNYAFVFFKGFCDFYGYSCGDDPKSKNIIGNKIFLTKSGTFYSPIRLVEYEKGYYLVEVMVSDKLPFE